MKIESKNSKQKKTWVKPAAHKVEIATVTKSGWFSCNFETPFYFCNNNNPHAS